MRQIKIGTIVGGTSAPELIRKLAPFGFECFELNFWESVGGEDIVELFKKVKNAADETGTVISAVGVYGNPFDTTERGRTTLAGIPLVVDNMHLLGTDIFAGFTGRVIGRSVEESMPVYKKVWGELAKKTADQGARIAFENCDMGGNWDKGDFNIAFSPIIWEMMFNALNDENIGLEWEPCHQLMQLVDPIPQLRKWVNKIFHVHGKDASIAWDIIRQNGIRVNKQWGWNRTPGFGDSNWADIISILYMGGYQGDINIEGFHDPVYRLELEYSGQVTALEYLKRCRGGNIITL